MQIEFYLPLPPDGFWVGLMIYYMAGLVVSIFILIKERISPPSLSELAISAAVIIPALIFGAWYNRRNQ